MSSYNIPLISIPLYYILALIPHGIAISRANAGNINTHHNENPQGAAYLEYLKKKLPPRELAAFERAKACHKNHMENMPLFIAAVFAGLFANARLGEDQVGLNRFVVGWMVSRVLYTVAYIKTETRAWARLRSILYFFCTGIAFAVLIRSARVLGNPAA
ncbi:unnamed protein product [Zymoseptoria tritici ST99CH_3D7]|uniref:MAPEG family protein n=1 Tax=Zymoseptoria tritici (strain ST99CH_3D7) TaxID=1276538 RepID=A0A1X7S3G2_ZYMT9|nr:unnamed protein product [Zymoseptoria tritici ST99CH_3D7]